MVDAQLAAGGLSAASEAAVPVAGRGRSPAPLLDGTAGSLGGADAGGGGDGAGAWLPAEAGAGWVTAGWLAAG